MQISFSLNWNGTHSKFVQPFLPLTKHGFSVTPRSSLIHCLNFKFDLHVGLIGDIGEYTKSYLKQGHKWNLGRYVSNVAAW